MAKKAAHSRANPENFEKSVAAKILVSFMAPPDDANEFFWNLLGHRFSQIKN
jgi:hypothetical protein